MDRLGELGLLGREVAAGVFRQLVREDEKAVERRSQLVRHIGEKLGFVLRRKGELASLFFEFLAGLFHLRVLAFHLFVLLGQKAGLLLQLFVGLLQLFLAGLKLLGQR